MSAASLVKGDVGAKEAQWFQRLEAVHGQERWPLIELALREAVTPLALVNPFLGQGQQERTRASQELSDHEEIPVVLECPEKPPQDKKAAAFRAAAAVFDDDDGPPPRPAAALRASLEPDVPLLPCCFLSGASALAALALDVQPGETVLDLCSAPGAKALVLASMLFGRQAAQAEQAAPVEKAEAEAAVESQPAMEQAAAAAASPPAVGRLVCNEPNRTRGLVLKDVLAAFLPPELLAKGGPVVLTSIEASHKVPPALKRFGPYDKVLVDVPSSALRKVSKQQRLKVGGHLNLVSPAMWECNTRTVKANAELAEELLRCAGELVRPGGLIVYCTSSLEERENDGVIKKFLQRVGDEFEVVPGEDDTPIGGAETTELGTMLLPDQGTLHGPLYLSRLRRA